MDIDEVARRLASARAETPRWPSELDPRVIARAGETPPWAGSAASTTRRDAAALVLLYPGADREAYVVLTVRPGGDHVHAGQVALPGGKRELGDAFPVGTALREAREEIGLDGDRAGVRIVGTLPAVDVRVSGFDLVPVLAIVASAPELHADEREVAELLSVPMRCFLPGAPIRLVDDERDGWQLRYGAYLAGEHVIWGATARVLGQLGAILGADHG